MTLAPGMRLTEVMKTSLNRQTRGRARSRRAASLPRWLLLSFCLLALAVQSFIVQTHVHAPGAVAPRTAISESSGAATFVAVALADDPAPAPVPGKPRIPIDEDQNCPLCQQFHGAGQFFAPSAALFALPSFANVRIVPLDIAALPQHQPSHNWRGRAPPQA
jgi:hypothetical protein